jgi:hypothetical protein
VSLVTAAPAGYARGFAMESAFKGPSFRMINGWLIWG